METYRPRIGWLGNTYGGRDRCAAAMGENKSHVKLIVALHASGVTTAEMRNLSHDFHSQLMQLACAVRCAMIFLLRLCRGRVCVCVCRLGSLLALSRQVRHTLCE